MKVRLCYRITIPDENGEMQSYGMALELDQIKEGVTHRDIDAVVDRQKLLDLACLAETVTPEQMELMDPDEFDAEFGDDLEDITERIDA